MNKVVLVAVITGQDGSYLAEFPLDKEYVVHGIKCRTSQFNTGRIDELFDGEFGQSGKLVLHHGDISDSTNLTHIIQKTMPDEVCNIAAQSLVAVSFEELEYIDNSDALGALRLLEAICTLVLKDQTLFYQASTPELQGLVQEVPQTERASFYRRNPNAVVKLRAHWITVNCREAYGLFEYNGILFNHEPPVRGGTLVTRKITRALVHINLNIQESLYLDNLDAKREWGHAWDYVEMQWQMLQQDTSEHFVIATRVQYSVRGFANLTEKELDIELTWQGSEEQEKAFDEADNCVVVIDSHYFRLPESLAA